MGFRPPTCDRPGRAIRTAFSEWGLFCAHSGTLSGLYPERRWPMERHCPVLGGRDGLAHTALILGGLECGRFAGGGTHLGGTAASAPSFGSLPGCSIRGRLTAAPTPGHVRPQCSDMTHTVHHRKGTAHVRKPNGRNKLEASAPCRFPPAPEDVGIHLESL